MPSLRITPWARAHPTSPRSRDTASTIASRQAERSSAPAPPPHIGRARVGVTLRTSQQSDLKGQLRGGQRPATAWRGAAHHRSLLAFKFML
jgi:hypothetical protein